MRILSGLVAVVVVAIAVVAHGTMEVDFDGEDVEIMDVNDVTDISMDYEEMNLGESEGNAKAPDPFPSNYFKIGGKACGTTVQCSLANGNGTAVPASFLNLACTPTTCPLDGCQTACDSCTGCKAFVYDEANAKCSFFGSNVATCDSTTKDTYKKCDAGTYATGGATSCAAADDWKVKVESYTSGDALTAKSCTTAPGAPLAAIGTSWMAAASPPAQWSFDGLSSSGSSMFSSIPSITTPCGAAACSSKTSGAVTGTSADAPLKVEIKTTGAMGWFMKKICIWSVKRGKKYLYSIPTWMNPAQTCVSSAAGCNHACAGNYNTGGGNGTQAWHFALNEGDGVCA